MSPSQFAQPGPTSGSGWSELVKRACGGERVATREVLRALAPVMLQAARRILGPDAAELDDVVQESLVAVISALPRVDAADALRGFATTTVVRRALRVRERWWRRGEGSLDRASADLEGDPSTALLAKQRAELLLDLLHELPSRQREALVLRYCLGHSLEETASMTEVRVNTVRSRIRLGRRALLAKLDKRAPLREALQPADWESTPTHGRGR